MSKQWMYLMSIINIIVAPFHLIAGNIAWGLGTFVLAGVCIIIAYHAPNKVGK